jgi:hypothetical protein
MRAIEVAHYENTEPEEWAAEDHDCDRAGGRGVAVFAGPYAE